MDFQGAASRQAQGLCVALHLAVSLESARLRPYKKSVHRHLTVGRTKKHVSDALWDAAGFNPR
jgi:hypothetical protein